MKNVGLLVTKNEGPILKETLTANTRYIDEIYALYGGDDETEEILNSFEEVKYCIHETDIYSIDPVSNDPTHGSQRQIKDGIRGIVYNEIKKNCEIGDWVTLLHGDEIFYHDPNTAVALASLNGFNVVVWYACHFFLTRDDLCQWKFLKDKPLEKKITWYATNKYPWKEYRQFQIQPDSHYEVNIHAKVIPFSENMKMMPVFPIYKHYKIWNMNLDDYEVVYSTKHEKNVSKLKEKWGQLQWEIKQFEDFFIDFYPGYEEKHQFKGHFGRFETQMNHALEGLYHYLQKRNLTMKNVVKS